jgi:hypothetical protein
MDEQLRFEQIGTGTELVWCSEAGVSKVLVVEKDGLNVRVQFIDQPTKKVWLTARQVEFECMTSEEVDQPSEPLLTDEDKRELAEIEDDDDDLDPADWWKRGGTGR